MTQLEIAQATGLSYPTVQDAEGGRISDETLRVLKEFARVNDLRNVLARYFPVRPTRVYEGNPAALDLHALVDQVLTSNQADARISLETFLLALTQYLRVPE